MGNDGKHATFAEPSSYSDDDQDECKAVEVTFDPSNPYRRKSSLVSSEATPPRIRHARRRDQCIVHQFLDAQYRGNGAGAACAIDGAGSDAERQQQQEQRHPSAQQQLEQSPSIEQRQFDMEKHQQQHQLQHQLQSLTTQRHSPHPPRTLTPLASTPPRADATQPEDIRSRLLTKQQLSDMAWGVRELSRRLSSIRIRYRVKSIFILTKIHDQDLIPKARQLTQWLLDPRKQIPYTVYVQDKLRTNKRFDVNGLIDHLAHHDAAAPDLDRARQALRQRLRYWDEDMCRTRPHTFDFVITLGGDGTVLYASWLFQRIVPPVLSFALGSLGFLTKFDFANHEPILNSAFEEGVTVSLRLRFECTVMRSIRRGQPDADASDTEADSDSAQRRRDLVEELIGEESEGEHTHRPDGTYEILNEVVVDRGPNPTMSSAEVFGDDEHFTSVQADGICVSTPTGSTAYNLAAGGSLCHPENPVMLLTSICAHTLSFRPIILPDTMVLRIGVPYDARTASWASFDGRERIELHPGDYVTISASRYPFASVQTQGRRSEDWANSISGKLGWNTRQKPKAFKEWER